MFNKPFSLERADGATKGSCSCLRMSGPHELQQITNHHGAIGVAILHLLHQRQEFSAVFVERLLHASSVVNGSFIFMTCLLSMGAPCCPRSTGSPSWHRTRFASLPRDRLWEVRPDTPAYMQNRPAAVLALRTHLEGREARLHHLRGEGRGGIVRASARYPAPAASPAARCRGTAADARPPGDFTASGVGLPAGVQPAAFLLAGLCVPAFLAALEEAE